MASTTELSLVLWLAACTGSSPPTPPTDEPDTQEPTATDPWRTDGDADGFTPQQGDCDDADPTRYPTADDPASDGIDQDCDGLDVATMSLADVSDLVIIGGRFYGDLGQQVTCGPDATGDGIGDLLIASPSDNAGYVDGRLYLASGASQGTLTLDDASLYLAGGDPESHLGWSSVALLDDPFLGGAEAYAPSRYAPQNNEAQVLRYSDVAVTSQDAKATAAQLVGWRWVIAAPDLDQNGTPDIVMGEHNDGSGVFAPGAVGIAFAAPVGDTQPEVRIEHPDGERLGTGPAAAADLDGDGWVDLVLPGDQGRVYVLPGPFGSTLSPPDQSAWTILTLPSEVPFTAVTVGELTGDGQVDVVVAGPGVEDAAGAQAGRVWVEPGPLTPGDFAVGGTSSFVVTTQVPGRVLGADVVVADVDGDGSPDLVVGMTNDQEDLNAAGMVAVFRGPLVPGERLVSDADWILESAWIGDRAGSALEACDLDGDGAHELVIGAPHDGEGAERGGKVYVVRGGTLK